MKYLASTASRLSCVLLGGALVLSSCNVFDSPGFDYQGPSSDTGNSRDTVSSIEASDVGAADATDASPDSRDTSDTGSNARDVVELDTDARPPSDVDRDTRDAVSDSSPADVRRSRDAPSGRDVDSDADGCASLNCQPNGTCKLSQSGTYECDCDANYVFYNDRCISDPCQGVDCNGHGTCKVDKQGQATCDCDAGYESQGTTCRPLDRDGDGAIASKDCDDRDDERAPGLMETCDGKDNDCDGNVDESLERACPKTKGVCGNPVQAMQTCSNGTWTSCQQAYGGAYEKNETRCDGQDNDCDGTVDEAPGTTESCYTGPAGTAGTGVCKEGTRTCTNGSFGSCQGETTPSSSESCDGKDNDCDGVTDESCSCDYNGTSDGVCSNGIKNANGQCQAPTVYVTDESTRRVCDNVDNDCDGVVDENCCSDGRQNGNETDVDCGGPDCAGCSVGEACQQDSDCQSKVCQNGTCQAPTCSDGVQNQNETDVDCGGPNCPGCSAGGSCNGDGDCTSGICQNGTCQAPTCSDGVQNGQETDTDCGGPSCSPCPPGRSCLKNGDCTSGVCKRNVCEKPTCNDGVTNGEETDIDCGGRYCAGCSSGEACQQDSDCQSNASCTSGTCSN